MCEEKRIKICLSQAGNSLSVVNRDAMGTFSNEKQVNVNLLNLCVGFLKGSIINRQNVFTFLMVFNMVFAENNINQPPEPEMGSFIFFIHGAGGRAEQWENQIQYFKRNYHISAPDLLGHGLSPKPKTGYDFYELYKDMEGVFDNNKKETNIVIGHSYGVALTLQLANKRGKDIDKLILIGGGIPRKNNSLGIWRLPTFILEWLRPMFSKNFAEKAFHPETDPEFIQQERAISDKNPMFVMKGIINGMKNIKPIPLESVDIPTLIIQGETDELTPLEGARELSVKLPNTRLEVVSKASHLVMMEQAEIVNKLISDFIHQN